jgi:hypothetical protein
MPGDNAATIAAGSSINFPQDGPNSASGISRITATTFNVASPGIYDVSFEASITEAGQLVIALNGTSLLTTVVGRATGTSLITGSSLITVSLPNTILELRNSSAGVITLTPVAGGASPVTAHLKILRLQ